MSVVKLSKGIIPPNKPEGFASYGKLLRDTDSLLLKDFPQYLKNIGVIANAKSLDPLGQKVLLARL